MLARAPAHVLDPLIDQPAPAGDGDAGTNADAEVDLHAQATAAAPAGPGFAHREPHAAWFERLSRGPDAAGAQHHLVAHLDAALDGADRVALWQALWTNHRRLTPAQQQAARQVLDGRHAQALAALDLDWHDPHFIRHVVLQGTRALQAPRFVPAWLQAHGLGMLDVLASPDQHDPALVMAAVQAAAHAAVHAEVQATLQPGAQAAASHPSRADADSLVRLQAAALAATQADSTLLPAGLAVLFELALLAGDDTTATGVLAELLRHRLGQHLPAERVRAWLDGSALAAPGAPALPLQLAPAWQPRWLQPRHWHHLPVLQAVHDALRRTAPCQRLAQLAALLGDDADPSPAPRMPERQALQALQALDTGYQLVEQGGDALPLMQPLLDEDTLGRPALAALYRAHAGQRADAGDGEAATRALVDARRFDAGPTARAAVAAAVWGDDAPTLGGDVQVEAGHWQTLRAQGTPAQQRLATYALARLGTDGQLEPGTLQRRTDLAQAWQHWTSLVDVAPYARAARAALRSAPMRLHLPHLRQHQGRPYLWVETPGATGVTVVPACVASAHSYPELQTLQGRLPGQHLLFVHNPEKNWYCDAVFDAVCTIVRHEVLPRVSARQVTCWYGSMGGHGAIKLALHFGFKAVAFNPQTDLDLWAAFRPVERALLWGSERHRSLVAASDEAWGRMPLYLAIGSDTADREALSVLIRRWQRLPRLTAIVEKFADGHHAGLMARISGGDVPRTLQRIGQRLDELATDPLLPGLQRAGDAAAFWQALDAARTQRVEIQLRQGQLWWQPSQATGTRVAAG